MLKMKLIQKARGFLFDLDGVFVQSGKPLHGAIESLKVLRSLSIPFRFLTNTTTKSRMTWHRFWLDVGLGPMWVLVRCGSWSDVGLGPIWV